MTQTTQYGRQPRPETDERYFNRELSWIEFNARVLEMGLDENIPVLERLRYLCIVANNFDEFFMVRVAGLKRQVRKQAGVSGPDGIKVREQLREISRRVHELIRITYECLHERIFPAMAKAGIVVRGPDDWDSEHSSYVAQLFREQFLPVLTPVRCRSDEPIPYAGNMRLSAAFLLTPRKDTEFIGTDGDEAADAERIALVQIPPALPRIIYIPDKTSTTTVSFIEDAIIQHAEALFPGFTVSEHLVFRVTRDADFSVDEERDEDFVQAMEQVLEHRQFSNPVRLSISGRSERLRALLTAALDVHEEEVYEIPQPLDLKAIMDLADIEGFDDYRFEPWPVSESPAFDAEESPFESVRRGDVLLSHPYESFSPVVRMVREAADDEKVLAIKMTLYRTSGSSPIVKALTHAAERGKQVTALVELKARFDEGQNIEWAERLERAGVIVVYGVARLKVHAKAMLIVRRETEGIRRYVHLGTGNYNEKTATLYGDLGLFTCNDEIAYEVGQFFNALTGYSAIPTFTRLQMAPFTLKQRILQLIQREAIRARSEGGGRIVAKMNSLADTEVIDALYDASRAGVEIKLNVRGICMLVPGVKGMSENIQVVSIVDRYLEHARIFYFNNGGNAEVYLSSADWMARNLERRVELLFPVENTVLRAQILRMLEFHLSDNTNAFELHSDGSYTRRQASGSDERINAQTELYRMARNARSSVDAASPSVLPVRRKPPVRSS
ncbi:MAG: polyphosphate kinase 1 [Spirochaetaceae bacterium]|nr:MAG: polyphosphate kinase 1 [Spirochaetaceae bacterium]